jgi:LPXTG-motif cell wall-anchored protein
VILRLLASVLLVVASFGATQAPLAAAQDSDDPVVSDETSEAGGNGDSDEASNLPALLIGAVLLGAGGWAYLNKRQRFPGAQFRD